MARPKQRTVRDKMLSVRVAPIIDARLQKLAEVGGQSPAVLASLALSMGLRMLEEDIYGTMPIDEIIKMGRPLSEIAEEIRTGIEVFEEPSQVTDVSSERKFKMQAEYDSPTYNHVLGLYGER